jgi:hypothetical protein
METESGGLVGLQQAHEWLSRFPYFGPFHSYEIVTDLRHTALLERAPDVMLWANPGPGCRRGMNRVLGRPKKTPFERGVHWSLAAGHGEIQKYMRELLAHSQNPDLWPREWPAWEMREVEHTLCEFDKYERVRLGEGRPRGVYR